MRLRPLAARIDPPPGLAHVGAATPLKLMRLDPFGRSRNPLRTLSREGRIEALAEVAEDLVAGRVPEETAAKWLGLRLLAWLESTEPARVASLERYLEVAAPPRSKATAQRIWLQKTRDRQTRHDDRHRKEQR